MDFEPVCAQICLFSEGSLTLTSRQQQSQWRSDSTTLAYIELKHALAEHGDFVYISRSVPLP